MSAETGGTGAAPPLTGPKVPAVGEVAEEAGRVDVQGELYNEGVAPASAKAVAGESATGPPGAVAPATSVEPSPPAPLPGVEGGPKGTAGGPAVETPLEIAAPAWMAAASAEGAAGTAREVAPKGATAGGTPGVPAPATEPQPLPDPVALFGSVAVRVYPDLENDSAEQVTANATARQELAQQMLQGAAVVAAQVYRMVREAEAERDEATSAATRRSTEVLDAAHAELCRVSPAFAHYAGTDVEAEYLGPRAAMVLVRYGLMPGTPGAVEGLAALSAPQFVQLVEELRAAVEPAAVRMREGGWVGKPRAERPPAAGGTPAPPANGGGLVVRRGGGFVERPGGAATGPGPKREGPGVMDDAFLQELRRVSTAV